jgi:hypothetical protein
LARFDGNLEAAGEAKLDIDELLSALSHSAHLGREERQDAIACFLSASEGWQEAKGALRGAFASVPRPSWLSNGKER